MPNRLAQSTSPYLLQHQDNPIDWYEWSEEAFAAAKAQDKPVLISVGYSSCHWCHVMAHESFEAEDVAELLNEHFICIKVDREERPDVDEAYMMAVQLISGRGGWPMTVFTTPDKKPFFAGTYFPKEDRGQYPGFKSLLKQLATLWKTQRSEVLRSANEVAKGLNKALTRPSDSITSTLPLDLFDQCYSSQRSTFDPEWGGFGEAPKFPSHSALNFLLDYAAVREEAAPEAIGMVFATLTRMVLGGIHDHVGGGFARYSTDREWRLPHFEKMLYDNALLLQNLMRAAGLASAIGADGEADLFERASIGIIEWLRREMSAPNGMFMSAIDADSEGEEGLFYLWSRAEIESVLGPRAEAFIQAFGIDAEGNYLDEATRQRTGLNLIAPMSDHGPQFRTELQMLFAAREKRERPLTDHKCLAAWNGMAITALAEAGEVSMAQRAAEAWLEAIHTFGELPHQVTDGRCSGLAFLDDYAHMCLGFAALAAATGEKRYFEQANALANEMVAKFADRERNGFFFTTHQHEELFGRTKPSFDQPVPSPNATAVLALVTLGHYEEAEKHLMGVIGWAQKAPSAAEALVHAMLMLVVARSQNEDAPVESVLPVQEVKKPVGKVTARLASQEISGDKGRVLVSVPEGVHVNTNNPPARWLVPTELRAEGIKISPSYPAGANDRLEGDFEIEFTISADRRPAEFELRLSFQACTDTECLPGDEIVMGGVVL